MGDTFEVRNAGIEQKLREIGRGIGTSLPEGWGFSLFIFSFGEGGSTFYISNAERGDMLQALQEFMDRQQPKQEKQEKQK